MAARGHRRPPDSQPLGDAHRLTIDSGEPVLDTWLRDHARSTEARRTGRTFVWADDAGDVVAYYTVSAHLLTRTALPPALGRGNPAEIPAVLLGKLALDRGLQGQGLGGVLLADALARIVRATTAVAARFVVVDAIDERAGAFYRHYGFRPVPGDGHRLVHKVSDVAASLRA